MSLAEINIRERCTGLLDRPFLILALAVGVFVIWIPVLLYFCLNLRAKSKRTVTSKEEVRSFADYMPSISECWRFAETFASAMAGFVSVLVVYNMCLVDLGWIITLNLFVAYVVIVYTVNQSRKDNEVIGTIHGVLAGILFMAMEISSFFFVTILTGWDNVFAVTILCIEQVCFLCLMIMTFLCLCERDSSQRKHKNVVPMWVNLNLAWAVCEVLFNTFFLILLTTLPSANAV